MRKIAWLMPLLIGLVVLPRLSIDLYLPSLLKMGSEFNASHDSMQMTLTVFMFGYAISMLIMGPLSDVFGRKKTMLWGLVLYVFSTLICAISTSLTLFIIARFFQAIGGCSGTVIARLMVKETYSRDEQIRIIANLSAAMAVAPLFFPILGALLQKGGGWQIIFYLLTLFACLLAAVTYKQIPTVAPHASQPFSLKTLFGNYKKFLSQRLFVAYSLTISMAWCCYFVFTLDSPFLFQEKLGFSPMAFSGFYALTVFGYLVGTRLTKRYATQFGWDKTIFMAIFCCLTGALLMWALTHLMQLNWMLIVVPMLLIMVGVGVIIPCTQASVMQPFEKNTGAASGLFFFIQMLFGSFCGLLLRALHPYTEHAMLFILVCASACMCLCFYLLVWRFQASSHIELQYSK
ncbi:MULTISPECIES: multidrug effflux MFS transporter [Legionella]|uniref:multidrug effflux MFS transporter n=1 Tax=Legionella TaxID=445 RepID=UPI000F8E3125|nr:MULTISPECIES: multidrug effflux MFS transporter [Legionella]MCP0913412.1 multidrug effflux MFS transporter [Legionella sp. 27cVA30]RUR09849.1 Bcr/CflA family efflux MFS transporter [Legionella septentrionalis]